MSDIVLVTTELKAGKSAVVCNAGKRIKVNKVKNNVITREVLTKQWTGNYIFESQWQSFRTRKDRALELKTVPHTYPKAGRHTIAVKVIDIFGNDTMTLIPVNVG